EGYRVGAVHLLQGDTATAATLCLVAHDQVSIDDQAGTCSVTRSDGGRVRHAVLVRGGAASRIDVRRTLDDHRATVGRDRRIGALVEQERVVFDITVVAVSKVTETAAVTRARSEERRVGKECRCRVER